MVSIELIVFVSENPEDYHFKPRNSVPFEEITDISPITHSSTSSILPSECYCEAEDEV